MTTSAYDVIVIGAGLAERSRPASLPMVGLRWRSSSPSLWAGKCSYYACIPSKALLRPSQALAEVERVPERVRRSRGPWTSPRCSPGATS